MLRPMVFSLIAFATAWFFAVATLSWMLGPVQVCHIAFDTGFCGALGIH